MSRFLTIVNGVRSLVSAIVSSRGAIDSNKIVATSENGRLDSSLIHWGSPGEIGGATPNSGEFTRVTTNQPNVFHGAALPTLVFELNGVPMFGITPFGNSNNTSSQGLRIGSLTESGQQLEAAFEIQKFGDVIVRGTLRFSRPLILPLMTNGFGDPWHFGRGLAFVGATDSVSYLSYALVGKTFRVPAIDLETSVMGVPGTVRATQFALSALNSPPISATATGTLGEIRIDANFIYVCTASNTWKRSPLSSW